jgi:hypothetical protein
MLRIHSVGVSMIAALITAQRYDGIPLRSSTDVTEPSPSDLSVPSDGQLPDLPITDAVSEGAPVARKQPIFPYGFV